MKTAYFDCFSGISGDMTIGALLDAGMDLKKFKAEISKLDLKNFGISATKVMKKGISATKFEVVCDEHTERNIEDIYRIIEKSSLEKDVKETSKKIFERIAKAESKIHNVPVSKIHFHEIGAVDSIIDIVGTAIALKLLGIGQIYCSEIPLGKGFVEFSHGKWPVPAPATIELLKGIPTYQTEIKHEIVTPTGAAIVSALSKEFGLMPRMKVEKIGYGAGSVDLEIPNVLRVLIGDDKNDSEEILTDIIETNIDNMNPEIYGYVMEKLFANGALDVFLTNIQMKKNRPGVKLSVISAPDKTELLSKIIVEETTSLGVRIYQAKRTCVEREFKKVKTKYGEITLKIGKIGDKIINVQPEYEDCVRIAKKEKIPLKKVYEYVIAEVGKINSTSHSKLFKRSIIPSNHAKKD